mmetsp:Transcript_108951/g.339528  ORF Transcript_108951/g.339528 Transcript_108951/m.339528 type:complete len:383 (+) Transcript_108951:650-1798(+)
MANSAPMAPGLPSALLSPPRLLALAIKRSRPVGAPQSCLAPAAWVPPRRPVARVPATRSSCSSGAAVSASHAATPGTAGPSRRPRRHRPKGGPARRCCPNQRVPLNGMSAAQTASLRRRFLRRLPWRVACGWWTGAGRRPPSRTSASRAAAPGACRSDDLDDCLRAAGVVVASKARCRTSRSSSSWRNVRAGRLLRSWLSRTPWLVVGPGPAPAFDCNHSDSEAAPGAGARAASPARCPRRGAAAAARWGLRGRSLHPSPSACRPGSGGSAPAPQGPSLALTLPRAPGQGPHCADAARPRLPRAPPCARGAASPHAARPRAPPEPPRRCPWGSRAPRPARGRGRRGRHLEDSLVHRWLLLRLDRRERASVAGPRPAGPRTAA